MISNITINKFFRSKFIVGAAIFVGLFWLAINLTTAQGIFSYPIPELGNCRDAKECYLYCEIPRNESTCSSYAYGKVLGVKAASVDVDAQARELGITFPVVELGNCANVQACFTYCEQPQNQQNCYMFAQKLGLKTSDEEILEGLNRERLLVQAQRELGCETMETCKMYCDQNKQECGEFVRAYAPEVYERAQERHEERLGVDMDTLLKEAKSSLGCGSLQSCEDYCNQNKQKCGEFLSAEAPKFYQQQFGGQDGATGTAGKEPVCNSQSTCEEYCSNSNDKAACERFAEQYSFEYGSTGSSDSGQGYSEWKREMIKDAMQMVGCDSEASCMQVCAIPENQSKCDAFHSKYGIEVPEPPSDE